jgi:hypothetical protein
MGGKGSGRPKTSTCGTPAGYRYHRNHGETACRACLDAYADYYAQRRRSTRRWAKPKQSPEERKRRDNEYQAERRRKQKAIINDWKMLQGECKDCGWQITEERLQAIDCDHRDPALKEFSLSDQAGSIPDDKLGPELDKCDARCRNCHAMRTWKEGHHLPRTIEPHLAIVNDCQPTLFDKWPDVG